MAFKAQVMERLSYDFRPYADIHGVSPEPTADQIRDYWNGYTALMRKQRDKLQSFDDRRDAITKNGNDPAQLAELEDEYQEWSKANTDDLRVERMVLVVTLVSNQPSLEELQSLPGRLFGLYESSLQDDLSPNVQRSDTNG